MGDQGFPRPIGRDDRLCAKVGILDAGSRELAHNGLEIFTLEAVGRAAGFSRGLPRYYFQNKDGLIEAIVVAWEARAAAVLRAASQRPPGLGSIIDLVDDHLAQTDAIDVGVRGALIAAAGARPDLARRVVAMDRAVLSELERRLDEAKVLGECVDEEPSGQQSVVLLGVICRGADAKAPAAWGS
jgi:AcrR family transcriptional regulator